MSSAILLGTSRYHRQDDDVLSDLPGVAANVVDFERILRDPAVVGLSYENVHRLLDERDATEVLERIADWSDAADDLLLFYFAGHGLLDEDGSLLLTLSSSTFARRSVNCLRWDAVKKILLQSPALKKIVILDCCFSGRADGLMADEESAVISDLDISGTVVLTSSPRNKASLARESDRRTTFTDALLGTVEAGMDTGRSALSIDEVFAETKARLRSVGAPEPQRVSTSEGNDIRLFLNANSVLSAQSSYLDQMVKHLEMRIDRFVSARLSDELPLVELDDRTAGRRVNEPLVAIIVLISIFGAIGEIYWLWFVGHPVRDRDYSTGYFWAYPNLTGFLVTVTVLILLSAATVLVSISALRSTTKAAAFAVLKLRRSSATIIARFGLLNGILVAVTAMIVPFVHWDY